jgi:hypothetical protein
MSKVRSKAKNVRDCEVLDSCIKIWFEHLLQVIVHLNLPDNCFFDAMMHCDIAESALEVQLACR